MKEHRLQSKIRRFTLGALLAAALAALPATLPAPAQPRLTNMPYVLSYMGFSSAVNAVAISADGRQALSGGHDNVLRLWDTATGLPVRLFDAETESINAVAFSPAGPLVLAGGDDKKLRVWEAVTGSRTAVMEGHTGEVLAAAFSPDGRFVASGAKDNTVRLWDTATGQLQRTFEGHSGAVAAVAFSPDGAQVLSASADKTLRVWEAGTGQHLRTMEGHADEVAAAAWSPDGQRIASGGKDRTVRLWEAQTGRAAATLAGAAGDVLSVAFAPDGRKVVTGGRDKALRLWDTGSGQLIKTIEAHGDIVTSAAFATGGRRILSGSWDKTLKLWDTDAGADQGQPAATIDVTATAFSPNGRLNLYYGGPLPGTPDLAKLDGRLSERGFKRGNPVFLRVFKADAVLELWMKRGARFELFATYPICAWSGQLGPKQAQGDFQSPEGVYTIARDQLNPASRYYRAFNLGYPNAFDRALERTGANLMVHGGCSSIGCYAMTDGVIGELWQLVTAALDAGQERVGAHVYPFRMTEARLAAFAWHPASDFWRDLKRAHDLFEADRVPPQVSVCRKRYAARRGDAATDSAPPVRAACPGR